MPIQLPRLLVASLAVATVSMSCSTPTEVAPQEPLGSSTRESGDGVATVPKQDPQAAKAASQPEANKPRTVQEQRAQALVEHWLGNARKMRAVGELEAAHLELLKAKDIDPANEAVAAELAEVRRIHKPPVNIIKAGGPRRFPQIAEQRAKAMVDYQLQTANKLISKRDYKGAAEELRRAELAIEAKQDIDWGDLPQQVKQAQEKVKIMVDALAG